MNPTFKTFKEITFFEKPRYAVLFISYFTNQVILKLGEQFIKWTERGILSRFIDKVGDPFFID